MGHAIGAATATAKQLPTKSPLSESPECMRSSPFARSSPFYGQKTTFYGQKLRYDADPIDELSFCLGHDSAGVPHSQPSSLSQHFAKSGG